MDVVETTRRGDEAITIHACDSHEQVGTGSHVLLAIQLAIAVVTPGEIQYPVTQV